MRIFFAITLPKNIQKLITTITTPLKKIPPLRHASWSKLKNLHLTIRFIGEITEEHAKEIIKDIEICLQNFPDFDLKLETLEIFPKNENPIALVLKPAANTLLNNLAKTINTCLLQNKISEETRSFNPHLTLSRIKHKIHIDINNLEKIIAKIKLQPMTFRVQEIKMLKSQPTPLGSRYSEIKHFSLKKL